MREALASRCRSVSPLTLVASKTSPSSSKCSGSTMPVAIIVWRMMNPISNMISPTPSPYPDTGCDGARVGKPGPAPHWEQVRPRFRPPGFLEWSCPTPSTSARR